LKNILLNSKNIQRKYIPAEAVIVIQKQLIPFLKGMEENLNFKYLKIVADSEDF